MTLLGLEGKITHQLSPPRSGVKRGKTESVGSYKERVLIEVAEDRQNLIECMVHEDRDSGIPSCSHPAILLIVADSFLEQCLPTLLEALNKCLLSKRLGK